MVLFRRLVVLAALLFWQGGGAFFGGVVIPIGRRVLAEQLHLQAMITRDATRFLNVVGVVALALMALDLLPADPSRARRRVRFGAWFVMAIAQAALFELHGRLSADYGGDMLHVID